MEITLLQISSRVVSDRIFERLELYDGELSRTVLRGGAGRKPLTSPVFKGTLTTSMTVVILFT